MANISHEEKILDMLGFYQDAFPGNTKISEKGLATYARLLSDYSIAQLSTAMDRLLSDKKTSTFFPSIGEIREAVEALAVHVATEGKGVPTVGDAWREAMRETERKHTRLDEWEFSTPEIERAVKHFGKWDLINLKEKDMGTAKAQFRDMYQEELRRSSERKTNNAVLENNKFAKLVDKLAANHTLSLEGAVH